MPSSPHATAEGRFKSIEELNKARRGSSLATIITLCVLAIVANLLSSIFYYVGLSPLSSLLSSVTWLSIVAALVWFYCSATGEFPALREALDHAVDSARPLATSAAASAAPAVAALTKKMQ